ncbi:NADH-quinone oxidoreductase subunit NuoF [Porticoccaceae bacterium]|jgi:NADH-quinone oxidoreductase subunit F|nr:NADH-quinone oxidoreductase subunit F [Porticoccaceae bacterium]MDC1144755.1 NADH-quinone oxidoreductase subunit NuoF [Porticoccaceae bacterium]MDG2115210.1 NADH-quinone oxidoreductase subunit NuoF [Porticoccaceae bacterium]
MEKVLTRNIGVDHKPTNLQDYEANGGYRGLRKAMSELSPKDCQDMISDSNLRGRGGAGFPTGMKWSFVPADDKCTPGHKYLVCNADEMEPGTFKDRLLMECDPHQLIEGMILAAYTIGADISYIFIRGEYLVATQRLRDALQECYAAGLLGDNILGSGYSLNMYVHPSAGRYICGEETALINALEGKRANPRAKPPFPQVSGLWGRPTIVNNVETLCNIPHIIDRGADWYKTLGVGEDAGTKLFGVSGKVNNPGCWELPMGTPIREIIEEHAGGMQDGYQLKGFLPGGGSTDFLTADHLDLAMDYNVIGAAGSRMGTGTMIILDDRTCPVGMVLNLIRFFAHESCGFCTPCRDGLPWSRQVLQDIEEGRGQPEDLETLAYQVNYIGAIGNTHCALAPGAMEPLQSALKYFYDDFKQHISTGRCPYH